MRTAAGTIVCCFIIKLPQPFYRRVWTSIRRQVGCGCEVTVVRDAAGNSDLVNAAVEVIRKVQERALPDSESGSVAARRHRRFHRPLQDANEIHTHLTSVVGAGN